MKSAQSKSIRQACLPTKQAFSLVEAVLAAGLFALVVTGFIGAILYGHQSTIVAGGRNKAMYLAEEGIEAVRNMRDENFTNLVDGAHGLQLQPGGSGSVWAFSGSADITDGFTRQITIATLNAITKNVTCTVTWQQTLQNSGTVTLQTQLTDWRPIFNQAAHLSVLTNNASAQ